MIPSVTGVALIGGCTVMTYTFQTMFWGELAFMFKVYILIICVQQADALELIETNVAWLCAQKFKCQLESSCLLLLMPSFSRALILGPDYDLHCFSMTY